VQEQVDGSEIGQFETLDFAFDEIAEESFDSFGGYFADDGGVVVGVQCDDSDVAGVAFVSGSCVGDGGERGLHDVTSVESMLSAVQ
jgi:hypothetical protein